MFESDYKYQISEVGYVDTKSKPDFSELIDLFYGNWIWRAVHALAEHPEFNSSPRWISNTLNISVEEALDALEGLEDLGLLSKKSDGNYAVKDQQFFMPTEKQSRSYSIGKHKQISQQIVSTTNPESTECAFSLFLSVESASLWEVVKKFSVDIQKLDKEKNKSSENSKLYALTLTCNNIAPTLGKGEGA